MKRRTERGQVLLAGVIMMVIFLLLIIFTFDVHNVIRAKLKYETAQQAAALAAANWQRESLNAIGELNLLKACTLLMESDRNWPYPLPDKEKEPERYAEIMQGRIDMLTEMQTRVSFLGPLIGFAAAQQAGKANGMRSTQTQSLNSYISRLQNSGVYQLDANACINHYNWRSSYIGTLKNISDNGVVILPNVRMASRPVVDPEELGDENFYEQILLHAEEIASGDPPVQSSWLGTLCKFVRNPQKWNDETLHRRYWNINYAFASFPAESEIYTLGLKNSFSGYSGFSDYESGGRKIIRSLEKFAGSEQIYQTLTSLPGEMKWFCYDDSWYPEYYRKLSSTYDEDHFEYWYKGGALRSSVKPCYRYEGPAAYAEAASLEVEQLLRHRGGRSFKRGILAKKSVTSTTIGSRRRSTGDSSSGTDYRPGAIAKALGSLSGSEPPIAVPLVLPVFDKVTLMPTYMPIPCGFGVLRLNSSLLEKFLSWLSAQDSIDNSDGLDGECIARFLQALRILADGRGFRFYGFNPGCTVVLNQQLLLNWSKLREKYVYTQKNSSGLGWLQEPKLCSEISSAKKENRVVTVADVIHGGMAKRVYLSLESSQYYVIDSTGHVVTNEDLDPTIQYNSGDATGGSSGYGGYSRQPDLQKGPARL